MSQYRRLSRALASFAVAATLVLSFVFAVATPTRFAAAQGFLIEPSAPRFLPRRSVPPFPPFPPRPISPRPEPKETPYKIESLTVDATIDGSVAQVVVSQTFKNVGDSTIETAFVFPLPYDGAIDSATLLVDGKEFAARLLDAKEARAKYEEIVRKSRDPALLEWVGAGMFQTSVFPIPPGASRTVTISYSQLLRTSDGLTDFLFPLSCAKYSAAPVEKTAFNLTIVGEPEIKNVYSPSFELKIDRVGKNVVKASCVLENKVPTSDFRLFFDRGSEELTAKIQSYRPNGAEDGYFLLLASPKVPDEERAPLPKTVVFALDVSGSMGGPKIAQARESLKFVLERLRDGDKFNVVLFGTDVRSFKETLQTCDATTRAEGLAFVDSVRASGSTNIESALKTTFAFLSQDDSPNPKYAFLLSDGEPTIGETNEMKLAELARNENRSKARVFSFGVGFDVNSRLLDRFVRDGRGQGEYVKPNENVEDRVSALYNRIESPIFSDVEFAFRLKNADSQDASAQYFVNSTYPNGKIDVFAGEQLVVLGRYSKSGEIGIDARGKVGDKDVEFAFDGALTDKSVDSSFAFIERLWAARRVGEIVDLLDLNGSNQELLDELLELSKKHGILTPYTSFLADDSVALNAASNAGVVRDNFDSLASQTSNASGFAQRSLKQSFKRASNLAEAADFSASSALAAAPPVAASRSAAGIDASGARAVGSANGSKSRSGGFFGAARRAFGLPASNARTQSVDVDDSALAVQADAAADFDAASDVEASASDAAPGSNAGAVRNVAGKTFFFKEGRWVDASIDEALEKSQTPVEIAQFGDEYFELIDRFGESIAQYLVFEEPTTLNFDGRIYRIDPQK